MKSTFYAPALFLSTIGIPLAAQIDIPIYLGEVGGALRIGIDVAFGDNGGATTPHRFLFDTGSAPLITNQGVNVGDSVDTGNQGNVAYGIGSESIHPFSRYLGDVVLFDRGGNPVNIGNVHFGSAFDTTEHPSGGTVAPGFGGILGAGPAPTFIDSTNGGNQFALYSALGQLAAAQGLRPGFTIDVASRQHSLQIGVSDEQIAQFEGVVVMNEPFNGAPQSFNQFPNTGYPAYNQKQISARVDLNGDSLSNQPIPVTIDTGAPTAVIVQGPGDAISPPGNVPDVNTSLTKEFDNGNLTVLVEGTQVDVFGFGGDDFLYGIFASENGDPFEVEIDSSESDGHLNTGIAPFHEYKITFLLDDGNGVGVVGFTPVPEPSSFALIAGAAALAWRRTRRRHG